MDELGGEVRDRELGLGTVGTVGTAGAAASAPSFGRLAEETPRMDAEQRGDEGLRAGEQTRPEDFPAIQLHDTVMVAGV
jgi:hypothetical protein